MEGYWKEYLETLPVRVLKTKYSSLTAHFRPFWRLPNAHSHFLVMDGFSSDG